MEMQQIIFNIYEIGGQREESTYRTEDIYQSLRSPPTAPKTEQSASDKCGRWKMFLPFTITIILLLTAVLFIAGAHYYHFRQTRVELGNGQSTNRDAWVLHEDMFYLFWSDNGDCDTAEKFCKKRSASLATVVEHNTAWLKSQTNGKRFLVKTVQSDSSGDSASKYSDEEVSECEVFGATTNLDVNHVEGWVCERAAK